MDDPIASLAECDGWKADGFAARGHYRGEGDRYSVEYYEPTGRVVYWRVRGDGEAVPVGRGTVPDPLRRRIREDLSAADVDPAVERDPL